jgi:hypothetical protein
MPPTWNRQEPAFGSPISLFPEVVSRHTNGSIVERRGAFPMGLPLWNTCRRAACPEGKSRPLGSKAAQMWSAMLSRHRNASCLYLGTSGPKGVTVSRQGRG